MLDERREHLEHRGVPLPADLVHDEHESGLRAAHPRSRLDELRGRERKTQHDHHVQPVEVDPVREHGRCGDQVDSLAELVTT